MLVKRTETVHWRAHSWEDRATHWVCLRVEDMKGRDSHLDYNVEVTS